MLPQLAFVRFKGDGVKRVVCVDDINDFKPRHSDDFNKDKEYMILCPHHQVEGSFSKESQYPGKIICLGATREAIYQKASKLGKKGQLPLSFLKELEGERREHASASNESNSPPSKSKRSIKIAKRKATQTRMESVLREKTGDGGEADDVDDNLSPSSTSQPVTKTNAKNKRNTSKRQQGEQTTRKRNQKDWSEILSQNLNEIPKADPTEKDGGKSGSTSPEAKKCEVHRLHEKVPSRDPDVHSNGKEVVASAMNVGGEQDSERATGVMAPELLEGKKQSAIGKADSEHNKHLISSKSSTNENQSDDTTLFLKNASHHVQSETKENERQGLTMEMGEDTGNSHVSEELDTTKECSDSEDVISPSHLDQDLKSNEGGPIVKSQKRSKVKKKRASSSSTSQDSSYHYLSSEEEKERSEKQIMDLNFELSRLRKSVLLKDKKIAQLNDDLAASQSLCKSIEDLNRRLQKQLLNIIEKTSKKTEVPVANFSKGSSAIASSVTPTSLSDVPSSLHVQTPKFKGPNSSKKNAAGEGSRSQFQKIGDHQALSPPISLDASEDDNIQRNNCDFQLEGVYPLDDVDSSENNRGTNTNTTNSEKKSDCGKKSAGKASDESAEDSNYASNAELAPMILEALKNPKAKLLQEDGTGKIHIGNNLWIKKEVFECKVGSSSVKNTIALSDLAEHVWGLSGLSQRSLEGGASPKDPNASRKRKATPSKKEAILACYRARLMFQGNVDKSTLDLLVSLEGVKTLRNKFSSAAKKARKELLY